MWICDGSCELRRVLHRAKLINSVKNVTDLKVLMNSDSTVVDLTAFHREIRMLCLAEFRVESL